MSFLDESRIIIAHENRIIYSGEGDLFSWRDKLPSEEAGKEEYEVTEIRVHGTSEGHVAHMVKRLELRRNNGNYMGTNTRRFSTHLNPFKAMTDVEGAQVRDILNSQRG